MKLSVVIPVYNVEAYLETCIASVQKLTLPAEIILVDDGSTDNSGIICDMAAANDPRIRVIHQENGGLSAARNTGIQNSCGDYIMFLDSDDFLDPIAANAMLSALDTTAEVLMGLYCNYYTEEDIHIPENSPAFLAMKGLLTFDEFLSNIPWDGKSCYITAWRFVVRRDVLISNDLFFLPGIYHEDTEWTSRLFLSAKNIFISHEYFYYYRQNRAGAITATVKPKHIFDSFTILERLDSFFAISSPTSTQEEFLNLRKASLCLKIMLNLYVLPEQDRLSAVSRLKKQTKSFKYLRGFSGLVTRIGCGVLGIRAWCWLVHLLRK